MGLDLCVLFFFLKKLSVVRGQSLQIFNLILKETESPKGVLEAEQFTLLHYYSNHSSQNCIDGEW